MTGAFRWVDDTLFIKKDDNSNKTTMVEIARFSTEMGVVTNTSKWREFASTQKYLGFLWDGKNKTVGLTSKKIQQRLNQINEFKNKGEVTYYEVEKLVGKLYHATLVYQQLRCHHV